MHYFQVTRPGGITPVQADDFEGAREEFTEVLQDLLVEADKSKEDNWACALAGTTFMAVFRDLNSNETKAMEITLHARGKALGTTFFPELNKQLEQAG